MCVRKKCVLIVQEYKSVYIEHHDIECVPKVQEYKSVYIKYHDIKCVY